ncbi:TIGR02391 family protein [Methylovorus mays]|uniref:TIGR02391 family protein n=1 Tax=Methylovorus mays TaxID=184077 RepID=UPI001E3A257F|nr:TIGR02391 family protein [Methylovorus mays]MCB5206572.1 TIGR02391 family protein [Methylovorus mays]
MNSVNLNKNQRKVLIEVFENERSGSPLNAKRFRVALFEHLQTLDFLENNNYIVKNDNLYELKIESLDLISNYDPLVDFFLHEINNIFLLLQKTYRNDPDSSLLLSELEIELETPRDELVRLVRYLLNLPIFGGCSTDLNEVNASITPSESVLKYESVYDVIDTVKSWRNPPQPPKPFQHSDVQQENLADFTFLLHPRILQSSLKLFESGHLREAVLNSMTAVFDVIRQRTEIADEDGDRLIGKVFSLESPYLIFSEIDTESGRSDQKGFIQIFKGAYQGIRNPNAHTLDHALTNKRAAQYLILASLMIQRVEDAKQPNQ